MRRGKRPLVNARCNACALLTSGPMSAAASGRITTDPATSRMPCPRPKCRGVLYIACW